jgi:hypothetical protein
MTVARYERCGSMTGGEHLTRARDDTQDVASNGCRLLSELHRASNFFQLFLDIFSFSLGNSFFDCLRRPID